MRQLPGHRAQLIMQTTTQETTIVLKTKELCEAILEQPELRTARQNIEKFMSDTSARAQYEGLVSKGQALRQKQQDSVPLSGEEISGFEKERDALMQNPVARAFLDAQEALHNVHQSINQYISKTLELGRVPSEGELSECDGEGGCGCGHNH
jgi:cell fate (sporulation/competence/biofilm development) regulator YlbF (YheA/YmcA/DUF963 family)